MAERKIKPADSADREIVITRTLDAPRERVWDAWTDPKQVVKWWGPKGFTTTIEKMDVRVGGEWIHTMHGPDGTDYPNYKKFLEVVKPERIVCTHAGSRDDDKGVVAEAIWTFDALPGNKTKVTIRMIFPTAEERDRVAKEYGAIEGGNQTLERMADYAALSGPDVFTISRTVDAPRDLVFKVWTEREHLLKWFTPKGLAMTKGNMDFRPGGTFHYAMTTPDGKEMWGKWTFRDITRPRWLTVINAFSDEKGGVGRHPFAPEWPPETLSQTEFGEEGGKTKVTIRWTPHTTATDAERAFFAKSFAGMNQGWSGTFEQLEEYLKKVT